MAAVVGAEIIVYVCRVIWCANHANNPEDDEGHKGYASQDNKRDKVGRNWWRAVGGYVGRYRSIWAKNF